MTSPPEPLDLAVTGWRLPRERPFTRASAAAIGMPRRRFERLVGDGVVERVLPGVYAVPGVPHGTDFRAEAVRLALRGDVVVTGRAAAWVHGVPARPTTVQRRPVASLPPRDVRVVAGLRLTSPLRTVLDLAVEDDERVALAVADRLVADGTLTRTALLAGLAGVPDARARDLLAQTDPRAATAAESVLRLRWHRSSLPTPVPGLVVPGRSAAVRLALGVPSHRFGVLLRSRLGGPDAAPADVAALTARGWWVVPLTDAQVESAAPELVQRHLEREYHQALLADVG